MSNDDWEAQRIFLAVLREGSLSGAARVLGLAQPTVRRRIEALEHALGAVLFTRSQNGLQPTELAIDLRGHAETMAIAADAFARSASARAGDIAGTVRVSASEIAAVELLPAILAPLMHAHPGLVIVLSASNRAEDLLRREADIAVRMVRPTQAALVAQRIGTLEVGLFARPDFLDRVGRPTTLDALQGAGLVGVEHDNTILRGLRDHGIDVSPAMFRFRADSDVAQMAAIRAGCGIGACQVGVAAAGPVLERVLAEQVAIPLETWVVTHEDLRAVPRIRAVFDALVEGLRAHLASVS